MHIAIIGAGLAGLTCAYELRGSGHEVDVYEATDRIGGKLYTVAFEGGPTDMGAEAFLSSSSPSWGWATRSSRRPASVRWCTWTARRARFRGAV